MPEVRPPDPARRKERARSAILKAALELTLRDGLSALTVDAIAARAGVGKQTIYRWWPSKGAVAAEAIMQAALPKVHVQDTGDLEADLRIQLRSMVRLMADPQFGRRLAELVGAAQLDRGLAQWLVEHVVAPLRARNRRHIDAAMRRGLVRAPHADVVADLLFGPVWFRLLVSGAPLDRAFADTVLEVVLAGVSPAGGRPTVARRTARR